MQAVAAQRSEQSVQAAIGQKQPPEAVYEKKVYSQYQSIRLKHLATFPRLRSHKCTSRVASATPGPSDS